MKLKLYDFSVVIFNDDVQTRSFGIVSTCLQTHEQSRENNTMHIISNLTVFLILCYVL